MHTQTTVEVPGAPEIAGLSFRVFSGSDDYEAMSRIVAESSTVDQDDSAQTVEDIERSYRHLMNSDPATDMVFAEIHGKVVGYCRVYWFQVEDGPRVYNQFVHLTPSWRGKGIRLAMLQWCENRNREIGAEHTDCGEQRLSAWAGDVETDWLRLLETEGFKPIRYDFEMVRDNVDDIPDLPLPEGLEVRPVCTEDVRKVWDAACEAFRDHWDYSEDEWSEEELKGWMESDVWQPDLWQVAWDGDEVAGMVLNFIDEKQNKKHERKRGYTETICVRRPYRRRGLARALIARSLQVHKDQGMTETALGVDTENPSGALQLYQSMGYEMVKRYAVYRKPLTKMDSTMGEDSG